MKDFERDFDKEYDDYVRDLNDYDLYYAELKEPSNFIEKIAQKLYVAFPTVSYDVAFACASTLFNSCLPAIRIQSRLGPLPLAEMNLIIGASGTTKTLPFKMIKQVIKKLGILLPDKYTTEGIEGYFARQVMEWSATEKRLKVKQPEEFEHPPYGMMLIDEISQMFKEGASKEYLAGSIETMALFYDMDLKATALSSGIRIPQDPYICLVGGTVPEFLPSLPDFIFAQGLAGRFHWVFIEPQKEPIDIDISDYRGYNMAKQRLVDVHEASLKTLLDINTKYVKKEKTLPIYITKDASKEWEKYFKSTYNEWYTESINSPFNYTWQYIRRLPELALRQAGSYAVSRSVRDICKTKSFKEVEITKEDIQKGIKRINISRKYLEKILQVKTTGVVYTMGTRKVMSEIYNPQNIQASLLKAKNQMLNTKQLWRETKIKDYKAFKTYLKKSIYLGLVKKVKDKSIIKDKEERRRLSADTRAEVWTVAEE